MLARDRMWRKSPSEQDVIGSAVQLALAVASWERKDVLPLDGTPFLALGHCNRVYCTEGLPYEKHACVYVHQGYCHSCVVVCVGVV